MDELTREQEEAVAATVGAIQRIAMAIVALPKEERAAQYDLVRRQFEASITEFGIEGAMAHAWLNSTMIGIQSLVTEIEAGGARSSPSVAARRLRGDPIGCPVNDRSIHPARLDFERSELKRAFCSSLSEL